jgi:transposase
MQPKLSRNGKRLWSKAQKQLIVKEALRPDMSVSKVSRRYDINANLIFRWIKAAGFDVEPKGVFVPIGILAPPTSVALDKQVQPSPPSSAPKMIEVELQSGTRIKIDAGVEGETLQQVLKLIRGLA